MKTIWITLFIAVSMGISAQKSVFSRTWTCGADEESGIALSIGLRVKDGVVKRGTVQSISMKEMKGENYKLESAELRGDTAFLSFSHKKHGNYKGRMIYHADEKAMYWILDQFDGKQGIIPSEMKLDKKHF